MKLAAVIIDSRPLPEGTIERHMKFLPECELLHMALFQIDSIDNYNTLLTSTKFWESLLKYDRVLIFQHDSGLLRTGIEEFYSWDYIGAPWAFQDYGGNGGLSLRNPKIMHKICSEKKFVKSIHNNEDIFFSHYTMHYGNLAPREECEKFSVESIYKLGTLGYHAIDKWLSKEQCKTILNQYAV